MRLEYSYAQKRKKKRFSKAIIKFVSILLIPVLFALIAVFLVYPHYNEIVIAQDSMDAKKITHSSIVRLFTEISPKQAKDNYAEDFLNSQAVEYVSPEILATMSNEGKILTNVEERNTNIRIESANIDAAVLDGESAFAMEDGPWHFPLSNGPGDNGNFVIIGHRFAELPPSTNTFFNLDKVDVGDKIVVEQEGDISYSYTVIETKVVEKNDRTVLQSYGDYRMTLITCTPLWTSKQRLIVVGVLDRAYSKL